MDIIPINGAEFSADSVAYTGTAGTTDAVWAGPAAGGPKGVLVWTTTDAHVRVGSGVTATTADTPIPAYVPFTFMVPANALTFVVSAIQVSSGGTLYAKPVGGV